MMEIIKRAVDKADGFLTLGLKVEAWNILDELPPEAKFHPSVLVLQVRILEREREWLKVEILAESVLRFMPQSAQVWLSLGRARVQLGKIGEAREALRQAFELDESLRLAALDDPWLLALW